MSRLAGLKFAPVTMSTHYEALQDLTADELDAAIERAARDSDEFPSPRQLRSYVDEHRARVEVPEEDQSRYTALQSPRTYTLPNGSEVHIKREWTYYCEDCSDTGMRSFWCGGSKSARFPWLPVQPCGRQRAHYEHEWADKCPCADSNPDVQRKKAQGMQVTRKEAN